MVTPCRVSPPMSCHMINRRCVQREMLLRPDFELVQCYYYILGYLLTRYQVEYHAACIMANHLHLLLTDLVGDQIQGFNRDLFSLMARSTNCFRGRRENLWSSHKPNCVCVAPRAEDMIDKIAYIVVNPVDAGLVSHAKKWPGVRVLPSEIGRLKMRVTRPKFFFSPTGQMPDEVELSFQLPGVWDSDPEELRRKISEECNRRERTIRDEFRESGRTFMGTKRVLRKSTRATAATREALFGTIPHVACKEKSLLVKFIAWRKLRQKRYELKRQQLLEGKKNVRFPEGTWALHFFAGQDREDWSG